MPIGRSSVPRSQPIPISPEIFEVKNIPEEDYPFNDEEDEDVGRYTDADAEEEKFFDCCYHCEEFKRELLLLQEQVNQLKSQIRQMDFPPPIIIPSPSSIPNCSTS